jgi:BirA family biotin operon repressor/biotin-[acetyl-CoA-carboxylase] ligase
MPISTPPQSGDGLNMRLLDRIRREEGAHVSWEELAALSGRVHDDLDAFDAFGFGIERHPSRGVAYRGPSDRLCPDQIEHRLATRRIGRRIAVWNRASSTNDLAARAASSAANDGLVVLAEEQTAGRGRRGRPWSAPPRSSILMSVVIFPPGHLVSGRPETEAADGRGWLTALGAVAVAEVVTAWTGRDARIKWPNDVRIDGRKVAGILVEQAQGKPRTDGDGPGGGAIIGIGLNANLVADDLPDELRERSTSLQILRAGEPVDRSELTRDLIRRLDSLYDRSRSEGLETLSSPWRDRSEHLGGGVRITTPGGPVVGRLVDLDVLRGLTLADPQSASSSLAREITIPLGEVLSLEGNVELVRTKC